MKIKLRHILLLLIFLVCFGTRVFFSYKSPYFTDSESYFHLRQIDNIKETGLPIYEDELSQGGRSVIFLPFYHYIMAAFSFVFPGVFSLKIFSNFIASLLPIIIYLITNLLIKRRKISLYSALLAGFIPLYSKETVNNLNSNILIINFIFLFVYFFLIFIKEKRNTKPMILLLLIMIFTSHLVIILLLGLVIYIVITYLEKIKTERRIYEIIFFSLFLFLWSSFIIYKKAFQTHGFEIIWQNVPSALLDSYFIRINLLEIIYSVGIIPIIFGIIAIYSHLFKKKSPSMYFIFSIFCATFLIFWFKLIKIVPILIFLGVSLILLSVLFVKELFLFIRKSKIAKYENLFFGLLILIAIITSFVPSLLYMSSSINEAYKSEDIKAFTWIKRNTNGNDIVLSTPEEGYLINYFGKRQTVIDTNYLLINDIDIKFNDTRTIYTASEIDRFSALRNIEKYNIDYIFFSEKGKIEYGIEEIQYINEECFELVYSKGTKIYEPICKLERK